MQMWKLILNVFVYKDCRVPELYLNCFAVTFSNGKRKKLTYNTK